MRSFIVDPCTVYTNCLSVYLVDTFDYLLQISIINVRKKVSEFLSYILGKIYNVFLLMLLKLVH